MNFFINNMYQSLMFEWWSLGVKRAFKSEHLKIKIISHVVSLIRTSDWNLELFYDSCTIYHTILSLSLSFSCSPVSIFWSNRSVRGSIFLAAFRNHAETNSIFFSRPRDGCAIVACTCRASVWAIRMAGRQAIVDLSSEWCLRGYAIAQHCSARDRSLR